MTFDTIVDFLKNNIWGIIIIGGVGSILGRILHYFGKKIYLWIIKHYRLAYFKYALRQVERYYMEGYSAGQAFSSSYHQIMLVGKFVIKTILYSLTILIIITVALGVLAFIPFNYFWIVIFLLGVIIVFPVKQLIDHVKLFFKGYEQLFDEQEMKKKAEEYIKDGFLKKISELKEEKNPEDEEIKK